MKRKNIIVLIVVVLLWAGVAFANHLVKTMSPAAWCRFQSNVWYCEVNK